MSMFTRAGVPPVGHTAGTPYITKDGSSIRELLHPAFTPELGVSLAEAVVEASCETTGHRHSGFDEIYYCLEGEGTLYINDVPHPFSPHRFYLLPKTAVHRLRADTRLRLLCVCCPAYTHEGTELAGG